jgi:hypothetical protein
MEAGRDDGAKRMRAAMVVRCLRPLSLSLSLSAAFNSSALDLVAICYELLLFFFWSRVCWSVGSGFKIELLLLETRLWQSADARLQFGSRIGPVSSDS